ncbi:type IV pilus secretin PilQ [Fulvimonas sp. R45]|uniref:type IV pilus secretin PilQ n=1 Tax=Fulvimonas sp. R45 TaxID=3045937 RepID=UPI00265EC0E8|nr:type IV pilus secretin PilQ [Fulvimonas sp. R45]MDO1529079.1 type IV pilus secretin PilQ [Fulvimonas sp. R45]
MTNRIQTLRSPAKRLASRCLLAGLLVGGAAWANAATAATTLKDIHAETLPGGRVALHLDFANGPVPQPRIFTTDDPPRIAVDLPDTANAAARHTDVGVGSTSGVTAVSAGGRTRVLVELMRSSTYQTKVEGDSLVLTVNNGSDAGPTTTASTIDPSKALPSATDGPAVSNIDFRRGKDGAGRVLIDFAGPGAHANMRREGDRVVVDLDHVHLPPSQAQRLDVLDFATPVQSIATHATPDGARMEIAVKGTVDTSSYQTGEQYVVEIAPKKSDAKTDAAKGQQPVYTGSRVTFNFQDIPVRSALQLLADVSGLNLVASDSVGGSVTLRLVNVPWDQALDVILRAKGLDKRRDGNVVWIAPQKELADYEQSVADARIKAEDNAPLITSYIPISYGKASEIAKLLTTGSMQGGGNGSGSAGSANSSRGFLSPRGSVSYDQRTNTLLLNDTAEKTVEVRKLVAELDKPVRQVLIESRIVIATDQFERDLGVKWGANAQRTNPSGQVIQIGGPLGGGTSGSNGSTGSATSPGGFNVNLPVSSAAGTLGMAILGKNYALDLELSAAQTEGRGEVISSPRVITANQQEADIKQGQEIGYVTYQGSVGNSGTPTASVQFKEAVLELRVTPTITADSRIYLAINVKKDALNKMVDTPNGQVPLIDTRSVNTSALVDNGQTVVLGGIYEITKNDSVAKVPGLGDIPVLGTLFRKTTRQNDKAELLIFVTPRILNDNLQ